MIRDKIQRISVCLVLCLAAAGPSFGWLYDGGIAQHAAVIVRDNSSVTWAAAPFSVSQNSYATSFGAAIARALGPVGSGFDVYLAQTINGLPDTAIASWKMVPRDTTLGYYYYTPDSPILLRANAAYSLVFVPDSPSFWGSISYSRTGYYGWGSSDHGYSWSMLALPLCVRVDGYAATPEPGSILVVLAGLSSCMLLRRIKS